MTSRNFAMFAMFNLSFGACGPGPNGHGRDTDDTDTYVTPTGTHTNPNYTGTVTVEATVMGERASLDVNLFDTGFATHTYLGRTWEPVEFAVGEQDIMIGERERLTYDYLPITTVGDRDWVAPEQIVQVVRDENVTIAVTMNQFIEGKWTCDYVSYDYVYTEEATMRDGQFLHLPGVGSDMLVAGPEVTYEEGTDAVSGSFASSTFGTFELTTASVSDTVECWKGGPRDRPEE